MPRTKPAEERRADLLAAGEALFVAKGVAATSLEDITNGASVSKGLFYLYFHSKDDLVLALQEQFTTRFATRIRTAVDGQSDWAAKLDAGVREGFDCFRELHDLHEVLFRHGGHDPSETGHQPTHAVLTDLLRELLDGGVAAGAFDVADTETTAVLLYVTMHAFDPSFHGRRPPTDDRLVRATQQLFRRTASVTP
jgi:TetR/AcrR family transcriptional repressor of nem operon